MASQIRTAHQCFSADPIEVHFFHMTAVIKFKGLRLSHALANIYISTPYAYRPDSYSVDKEAVMLTALKMNLHALTNCELDSAIQ